MNDTILNRLLSHIQSKGIIISDIKRLTKAIVNDNYNRVMKPYLKLFGKQNFEQLQITTDDLLNLYELDKKISILFLDHLLDIEKRLNTQIAYIIEDTYRIYDGCLLARDKEFLKHQIFSNASSSLCGIGFDQLINKMTKYAHINPNTSSYENVSRNNLYLK
ncbi:MAG: Abi family protein [Mycoplasmoidaceae bacterium]|nr:Abi family protein [Mycoplasmoidaceae bacterium]